MMKFANKVAIVTGAASGIGRALAIKCAEESMNVVIADINGFELNQTKTDVENLNYTGEILAVTTDVTDEMALQKLKQQAIDRFGVPDLLFNNAGIGGTSEPVWEMPTERLQWVLNVNLLSVHACIRAFVPSMLEADKSGHIINTASIAGFCSSPFFANYQISKHGVVVLSECLFHDLQLQGSKLNVSVLCPGWVKTDILKSSARYPLQETHPIEFDDFSNDGKEWLLKFARNVRKGISPKKIADMTFEAILENRFYIHTHKDFEESIKVRQQAILNNGKPTILEV